MRKINLCYFLFVGVLVSCTNTYDVCEMQRNETEDMSSRMAGDGVYDVLGFGYPEFKQTMQQCRIHC